VTETPRITVLISTYRNARFVTKKLAEIRKQSWFDRTEFIFIETASPERERELLAPFCDEHPNCRVIAINERRTLYGAWNLGWAEARAPLVCYSNMDDTMHPRLLECIVHGFERKRWGVCSVLIAEQPANDPRLDDWSPARLRHLKLNTRPGPFTAWRKDLAESIGMFDPEFNGAGDLDFWSRVQNQKIQWELMPKILYLYTKSPQQLSKSSDARLAQDDERLASKPYSIGWPKQLRWQVRTLRFVARCFPSWVCIPPME
jgi:glycosyltransferase involved in cell wall biosynthesis